MNKISEVIALSVEQLSGSDTARLDAELLLAEALGKDRTWLFTWPERELESEQLQDFRRLLAQRIEGRPIAHILGRREFWGLELECNEYSLIPRPETELLVEIALDLDLPADARVLDLGTGTGAIALALSSERPDWEITAIDLMPEALELAKRNASKLNNSSINWQQGSWFTSLLDGERYDLIVSNPPYVEESSPWLNLGDVRFEPRSALIAGEDGLRDLQIISEGALNYLVSSGHLMLEHGSTQAEPVQNLMINNGYRSVSSFQDLAKLDRVTIGRAP